MGSSDEKKILQIPLGQIKQIVNSRITYDQQDLSELMTSMKHRGLLTPIGVKKIDDKSYQIVFGNRRYLAAQKLDWDTIDCVFADAETDEDLLIVNAVENMQRADVPLAEQGRIFYALLKKGLSEKEIAAKIGIDHKKVQRVMHLYNKIPKELRPRVTAGKPGLRIKGGQIPATSASLAIDLSSRLKLSKEKSTALIKMAGNDGMTGTHIRTIAGLVKSGHTLRNAVKAASNTKMVTISVAIPFERVAKLEKEFGVRINDILYNHLRRERWLGIIYVGTEK